MKWLITSVLLSGALAVLAACGEDDAQIAASTCAYNSQPVRIEGGNHIVGSDETYPEEGPARETTIGAFWIEPTEVTVSRFRAFTEETGYITLAERPVDPAAIEGFELSDEDRAKALSPGGAVFRPVPGVAPQGLNWWKYVPGANWRMPQGPEKPAARDDEPVTQIAYEDALAFAAWAGGRLPTEDEWEVAATAGDRTLNGERRAPDNANTWQGIFPVQNSARDGYDGVAPVGCFAPNGNGLHDMIGNVWEWTADPHTPSRIPSGDIAAGSAAATVRTIKGGSFLCADNYCLRYRPAARHAQETGMGTNHIGIRIVYDEKPVTR